ncbi:MAG: DUF3626 domain-containing protein [Desmonostoc geniculatum HA4340-LM1]|jgi:hypothetical protein|nr:DUF3626 domain-containing protein [Desmonostoc geniculatum HA4340-LM1]
MPLHFSRQEYKFVGLFVTRLLCSKALEFADSKALATLGASSKTQIKDKQSLLDLKRVLESSYTDGITAIPEAYIDESGSIAGVFEDKVSPNLTKRLKFKVTDSDVSYSLLNPNQVESFSKSIEFATSVAPKSCKKGIPCGGSCISANKTCKSQLPPAQKTKVASIKATAAASATPVGGASKAPSAGGISPPAPATTTPSTLSRHPAIKTNDTELDAKRQDLEKRFGKKAVEDAENNVKRILDSPDVAVHVRVGSSATLELILGDRFKTSAELGIDTHQIPHLKGGYQAARNRVEAKTLGYDEKNTKPEDRPIYGYLGGKDMKGAAHADVSQAYGSITVKLKQDVKDRSTFTGADSFKSGVASDVKSSDTPPPPNAAAMVSSTRHGYDKDNLPGGYPSYYADKSGDKAQLTAAAKAKNIDDLASGLSPTGNRYVEAQVHGKVTSKDIAEIHFEPKGASDRPTAAIAKFAKDNGVDLYVSGKKLSSKELDDIANPPKDRRSQRLKDLDDAITKGDIGKLADLTEKIHDDAKKVNLAPGERDRYLKHLYAEAGYDAKPEVKSQKDMDALAQGGAVMMTRGVSASTGADASKMMEQFRTGDYHTGNGIYGNGTYVGHSGSFSTDGSTFVGKSDAKSQKRAWDDVAKHGYIVDEKSGGATLRMALKDDAVVMTARTMQKEIKDLKSKIDSWEKAEKQKILSQSDPKAKKEVDAYKKSLDINNAKLDGSGQYKMGSMPVTVEDYTIPHKNSKYGSDVQVKLIKDFFGDYSFAGPDGIVHKMNSGNLTTALRKARQVYADHQASQGNPNKAAELNKIEDKAIKAREVLFGDLGTGTSGRYAVARGVDAIALNNSYEKDSFMNLLNRGKVIVQDKDLSYADGKKKGTGA